LLSGGIVIYKAENVNKPSFKMAITEKYRRWKIRNMQTIMLITNTFFFVYQNKCVRIRKNVYLCTIKLKHNYMA